ncbi:N-acetylmuramoyl-L-alanine amidase [Candidatus Gracilibacteria bacterium]|nr:N-acetylmuramoyl-L-alanine amidase [Candidatus Gracilibacteria bacterium]
MKLNLNFVKYFFVILLGALFFSYGFAGDWNLQGINIISRTQRGADESLRLSPVKINTPTDTNKEQYINETKEVDSNAIISEYIKEVANNYLLAYYYNDVNIDSYNRYFGENSLRWTESIKNNKTKIIIHHTAKISSGILTKDDAIKEIQDIYKYHTVKRGWGDIGYNFLIDPMGNIYEGRAGGEGVIGAHAKWNNSPSIGISLMGNFEIEKPSAKAIESLIRLSTVLAKKYKINPKYTTTYHKDIKDFPYIESQKGFSIAGHKDAGSTACPGKNLYNIFPYIRDEVYKGLNTYDLLNTNISEVKKISDKLVDYISNRGQVKSKLTYEGVVSLREQMKNSIEEMKEKYGFKKSKNSINKIEYKISKEEAKSLSKENIKVLLYELSFDFNKYDISCLGICKFQLDGKIYSDRGGNISIDGDSNLILEIGGNKYNGNELIINTTKDLIVFKNYDRKSYFKKPWNIFRGNIIIKKDKVKDKKGNELNKFVVINDLPFSDYMKGIVETNDGESIEKNIVMSLVSKTYALFYMKNTHPNIPIGADYNAVDDADVFQKYVGAGLEITLKRWFMALKKTENKIITFDGYIPILPYFNCSMGFTYSAEEKRGWRDTPYLISNMDITKCSSFLGHGVGMSGKGAEYWAKNGWTYEEILKYYYPGIKIESF